MAPVHELSGSPTCKASFSTNLYCKMFHLLILQSGDIEINPGPPKYECGISKTMLGGAQKPFNATAVTFGPMQHVPAYRIHSEA